MREEQLRMPSEPYADGCVGPSGWRRTPLFKQGSVTPALRIGLFIMLTEIQACSLVLFTHTQTHYGADYRQND